ncbi:MAG: hypothetical protein KAS75_00505 [Planctomycetes bacterium]|nr:hypothetical protein [Planctomycetota bacterium]
MAISIKGSSNVSAGLYIAFLILFAGSISAGALPTVEDIDVLAKTAKQTVEAFTQKSFEVRMGYEYNSGFLKAGDRESLSEFAKTAGSRLGTIIKKQEELKGQIEGYAGDDWEDRYGTTGLWRKLSADLYSAVLSKCEIDFYAAVSAEQLQRDGMLQEISGRIDSLQPNYDIAYLRFLKAKTFALRAQTEATYKSLASKEFDAIIERSDVGNSTVFRTKIERIKLLGESTVGQLKGLSEELVRSDNAEDIELVLSLAFLQRQYDSQAFERVVELWPQTEGLLGSLILSRLSLSEAEILRETNVFEAELAVGAAWKDKAGNHKTLLKELVKTEKFRTPLIMYVAAMALEDSSPVEAIELLVEASKLQETEGSDKLGVSAREIAELGTKVSCNLFVEDSNHCQLFLKAFDNYFVMAGKKIDEELEYVYSVVLDSCGQIEKRRELLGEIAGRAGGSMRNTARLELIKLTILENNLDEEQNHILFGQLSDLIIGCTDPNEQGIRTDAMVIYCLLPFEVKDEQKAQKVLDVLGDDEVGDNPILWILKAKVLRQTGKLDESVDGLIKVFESNYCEDYGVTIELVEEISGQLDLLQWQRDDFGEVIQKYKHLGQFAHKCLDSPEVDVFLVETSILAAENERELSEAESLLETIVGSRDGNDVDLLRCKGRLLVGQGKFEEAGRIWGQVGKIRKGSLRQQSWEWWRAKYYELYCWSQWPETSKEDVLHTIEILESSYEEIPALWAEKLGSLKQ